MWGRALLIALVVGIGLSVFIGIKASVYSFVRTRDTLFNELALADLEIIAQPLALEEIPDWSHIPGVISWDKRLVSMGHIPLRSGKTLATAVYYLDSEPTLDRFRILEGNSFQKGDLSQGVMEQGLQRYHGFQVGDSLELESKGGTQTLKIVGSVLAPEFLMGTMDPNLFVPLKGSLGVVYLPIDHVIDLFGYPLYNSFLFRIDPKADFEKVKREILKTLEGTPIRRVLPKAQQPSYQHLQDDVRAIGSYADAMVLIFSLVAFLATFLSVNRLIQSQRVEIGALRALGFSTFSIALSYVFLSLVLALGGAILGVPASYWIRHLFTQVYLESHGLAILYGWTPLGTILKGMVLGWVVTLLGVLVPLIGLLLKEPQEILRPRSVRGKGRWIRGWRRLEQGLPPIPAGVRLGVRNLWRHPGLVATTLVSISFSIAAGIGFSIGNNSLYRTSDKILAAQKWTLFLDFNELLEPEGYKPLLELEVVEQFEPYLRGYVEVFHDSHSVGQMAAGQRVMGIPSGDSMNHLDLIQGRTFEADRFEVVINRSLADRLGVWIGDSVILEGSQGRDDFMVVGVVSNFTLHTVFAPLPKVQSILGLEDFASGAMVQADRSDAVERIYQMPMVGGILTKQEFEKATEEMRQEFGRMVRLARSVSVVIALLFIFSTLMLGAFEREEEYATLQALGFGRTDFRRMLSIELVVQAIIGLTLSIPLALTIGDFLVFQLNKAWGVNLHPYPRVTDFFSVFVPAILVLPFTMIPILIFVYRIDLVQAVRRRILG